MCVYVKLLFFFLQKLQHQFSGQHLRTLVIEPSYAYGIAVTRDGRYMAVSYYYVHTMRVYRIEADGTLTLLHTIGGQGVGPMQFHHPYRICLAPNGNVLVCDQNNHRVQELTQPGDIEPAHVRDMAVGVPPRSIASRGDIVAVGTCSATVVLLSYATGAIIRTFGSIGPGRGEIGTQVEGIRFTADSSFLVIAEHFNKRLSSFRVSDGTLVDVYCEGQIGEKYNDLEVLPTGEVIVSDHMAHRVCVFSADGRTLLRTWGTSGTADGQFSYPTALALVGNQLFVISSSSRVQVFS